MQVGERLVKRKRKYHPVVRALIRVPAELK